MEEKRIPLDVVLFAWSMSNCYQSEQSSSTLIVNGKDSVPYKRKVVVAPLIHKNLAKFVKNKSKKVLIFDKISV